jgi:glutamate-1-semialdehyde 2,1-aminomutase
MVSYERSAELLSESRRYLAGGVASSLRAVQKPVPLFAESGSGSRVRDVDGNVYIDYLLAYGPLILGHAHPALSQAVHDAMQKGATFGLQHGGEIALARRLTELLPCADRVALSGSGTEAVMLALRLARAYTGRSKVVRFHGHFHGWSDAIFTAFPLSGGGGAASSAVKLGHEVPPGTGGQSRSSLSDVILIPWNDAEVLERTLRGHAHEIAAVISEPIMCNNGCIVPKDGYLQRMRELTAELGIVMILDEVITGFRLGLGGAHERYGVMPDLVTIGKALGGGIAVSGVAGSAKVMKLIEDGTVSHLGTLNGNGVAMAAALATIEQLAANNGAAFKHMERIGDQLVQGIRRLLAKHGIPGLINTVGPVFHFMFTDLAAVADFDQFNRCDKAKYARFAELMLENGVLVRPSGLWYVSAVHTSDDVEATLAAVDRSLAALT